MDRARVPLRCGRRGAGDAAAGARGARTERIARGQGRAPRGTLRPDPRRARRARERAAGRRASAGDAPRARARCPQRARACRSGRIGGRGACPCEARSRDRRCARGPPRARRVRARRRRRGQGRGRDARTGGRTRCDPRPARPRRSVPPAWCDREREDRGVPARRGGGVVARARCHRPRPGDRADRAGRRTFRGAIRRPRRIAAFGAVRRRAVRRVAPGARWRRGCRRRIALRALCAARAARSDRRR